MSLSVSLDHLYALFAAHRVRSVWGCSCCVDPAFLTALKSIPLRELPRPILERYAWSAMSTIGDERHFKHFLPRMLELALFDDLRLDHLLERAGWSSEWTVTERAAVDSVRMEQVLAQLAADQPLALEQFSCARAQAHVFVPRLEALLSRPVAPRWYAQLVLDLASHRDHLDAGQDVLLDWVLSTRRADALERAFFSARDASGAALFSNAVLILEWFN